MTHAEIIGSLLINAFVLVVGAVCSPLFKRLWKRMNQPSPLTPKTKGQLTESLAMSEFALDRLNYLDTHAKDLFLYLIGILFSALFLSVSASIIYVLPVFMSSPYLNFHDLVLLLILALADIFCIIGLVECSRMSDKRIQGQKDRIQKTIDVIKKRLDPSD